MITLTLTLTLLTIIPNTDLVDRADLSDPYAFILETEQLMETNKQILLEQKEGSHQLSLNSQWNTLFFNPQKHPELIDAKLAIRNLLAKLHITSKMITEERKHAGLDERIQNPIIKALQSRGVSNDDIVQIMKFANYSHLGHIGIVAIATERLEKRFFKDPFFLKDIENLKSGHQLPTETIKALTDTRFYEYPKVENAAYSDFLRHFSNKSRKIILIYAYERLLQEESIMVQLKKLSWNEIYQEYVQLNKSFKAK